jgi:hypothetical protein
MFQHIKISALALGIFAGYIVPLLVSALLYFGIQSQVEKQNFQAGRSMFGLMIVINIFGSIAGGYVSAAMTRHQQLLHGLLTAIVGYGLISPFGGFSFTMAFVFLAGGIVGAWLRK